MLPRFILIFVVFLVSVHICSAFEILEVSEGSIGSVSTYVEGKIENWGFKKVFFAFPKGWELNELKSYAKSYMVMESGLWRKYGLPTDKNSLIRRGFVYTRKGLYSKAIINIGGRYGFWLLPNEGVIFYLKFDRIGSSGEVDPFAIEEEYSGIKVVRWYQSFTLNVTKPGIIKAPWIVKGAKLVEASPAPYTDITRFSGKKRYIVDVNRNYYSSDVEVSAPDWQELFDGFENSLAFWLKNGLISMPEKEFRIEVDYSVIPQVPVWIVDKTITIEYAYEWRKYRKIEGITFWRDELKAPA